MKVIGLLGGVASGKSTIAQELGRLGAGVLDADRLAHQALADPTVVRAATARWGERILDSAGAVDRRKLSEVVFHQHPEAAKERTYLESLIHPRVRAAMQQSLHSWRAEGTCPLAVLDVPLLLEVGWDDWCDELWMVETPEQIRRQRCLARGWTEEQWQHRQASQQSLDLKRQRADRIIAGVTDPGALRQQLVALWQELVGSPPRVANSCLPASNVATPGVFPEDPQPPTL